MCVFDSGFRLQNGVAVNYYLMYYFVNYYLTEAFVMARTSLSIPDNVLSDLTYVSSRMGVSKSALVTEILVENLHDLKVMFEGLPPDPDFSDESVQMRLRGASIEVVKDRIKGAKGLLNGDDLFSNM